MASLVWLVFIAFILLMLALDLGVFHKKEHVVSTREALRWTALWVSLALASGRQLYGAGARKKPLSNLPRSPGRHQANGERDAAGRIDRWSISIFP